MTCDLTNFFNQNFELSVEVNALTKGGVKTFMGSSALGNEAIISSLASNSSWSNNLFSPKTERLGAPHKASNAIVLPSVH